MTHTYLEALKKAIASGRKVGVRGPLPPDEEDEADSSGSRAAPTTAPAPQTTPGAS